MDVNQVQCLDQQEDENLLQVEGSFDASDRWSFIEEKVIEDDVEAADRKHAIVDDSLEWRDLDALIHGVVLFLETIIIHSLVIEEKEDSD